MGRNLNRNQSALQFEKYYKGCIWGLLPLHFQSFKKSMLHINQKHVRPFKPGLKTDSNESDDQELKAKENTRDNIFIGTSKEDSHNKGRVPQRPQLRRTYSIHRLEPPDNYFDVLNADHKHPVVIHMTYNGSGETDNVVSHPRICANANVLDDEQVACDSKHFGKQGLMDQAAVDKHHQLSDHTESSFDTYEDFFDAFQIDKKLFMKSTQNSDADDSAHSHGELKPHRRVTFRRSGSFPMGNKPSSRYGSLMPCKLESKLAEVCPSSSSSSSSCASSSSFHHLEDILPRSRSCTLLVNMFGELATEKASQYGTDQRVCDYTSNVRRYKLSRIRRAASLNESMERYTQLFETSFRRDVKLNISKSLRLPNEDKVSVSLRKVQSMREALQLEWRPDTIEFSKVSNKSESVSIEREQSDSEVNKDESCAGFEQQLSCSYSWSPRLSDEVQIKSNSDPYSQQLSAEDIKTATSIQDDFLQDGALRTEDTVIFSYEQNALNIFEALGTGNSLYNSTELNIDLNEQLLSDLVHEALIDVYNRFEAYWPTPLCSSSNCHIHPLPNTEQHIQSRIQKLQSFSLKTSNSMDNVVSYDMAQDDGWMNLQAEAESLGLALDEMIFDELVEEFMYE